MNNSQAVYSFLCTDGSSELKTTSTDAVTAFRGIKQDDQNNYFKLRRYEKTELCPTGYSLLDIGYGLSVAYRRDSLVL